MQYNSLPVLSSDAGLYRYLEEIKKFPVLTEEEELQLVQRWYTTSDLSAAHVLVTSHLRLVAKIAMQYKGYGLPMIDLISEGNIGLMTAVKKFDPNHGTRLSTYAMWWIKAMIQDYILKSWSIVKFGTSAAHKKLFFNLRKVRNKLAQIHQGKLPDNENALIAKELDVSEQDVQDMKNEFENYDSSLNSAAYADESNELIDLVADEATNQESIVLDRNALTFQRNKLHKALMSLNERERDIFESRRLSETPKKLEELSSKYGISCERVRQIEEASFKKIVALVNNT